MKKQLEKAVAAEKDCKRKVREYERRVDQMSLAEKRCQIDKSDLRNQLKQSQEERRQDAAEFNTRITNITAELDRCKNLLRETESSLNAANHTVNVLREGLRTIQEELAKHPAEIKNPAAAGGGAIVERSACTAS
jgi:chromosome segregation ATPase